MSRRQGRLRRVACAVWGQERLGRMPFWTFAPFGLAVPIAGGLAMCAAGVRTADTPLMVIAAVFLLALPLMDAGRRRLQDAGAPGGLAYAPALALGLATYLFTTPEVVFGVAYLVPFSVLAGGALASPEAGVLAAALALILLLMMIVIVPVALILLVLAPIVAFTQAAAHCILPSEPRSNRFGPNPHESDR